MRDETIGKLIRALGVLLLDKEIRFSLAALAPKALEQCKQAWLEAVNQLPAEGQRLLLDLARRAGLQKE